MNSDIIWLTIFTDKTRKFVLHSLPKSTLPEFYVLPKVHKHPIKGQPIIQSFNWVTTNLRRSLDCTLCPILLSFPWILRDLKKLLQQLASISVPQTSDVWLLKEDVTSFYSSLPSDEGCQIFQWLASKNGYSEESSHCLSYIMLSVFETTMGTACAPKYASLFAAAYESLTTDSRPTSVVYYGRFLDVILVIVKGSAPNMENLKSFVDNSLQKLELMKQLTACDTFFATSMFQKPANAVERKTVSNGEYLS
ncbi:reverse transcriptase [Puccinia sorghi]|uniref:Reverse transcriptase n=1 Tax=Puccinia sorghi TaxID=27349 RepID=A0A0L6USH0_9BASI|nr:reverse transcriptase [Puccinia sorghi]